MKRKPFILVLILLLTISLFGQEKSFTATADQLSITVVNLRKPMKDGKDVIGTGSFIEKDGKLYIITASHVAKVMDNSSYVILQGENNKPVKLFLFELVLPIKWQYHKKADLAILKLDPSKRIIEKYLQNRFIPYSSIDTCETSISRNIQLTIIGFPLGMGVQEYFSPLTYRTFPSSGLLTLQRFDTTSPQTFIILESPSIGGYSGGPVYDLGIIQTGNIEMNTGKTVLHGFIHGTLSDITGGKLSAITPAFYVKDFFKMRMKE